MECNYLVWIKWSLVYTGGTFALYSLLCRHLKAGLLSISHGANRPISIPSYNAGTSVKETRTSLVIKGFIEKHQSSRVVLLLVVLLGTSMVIGDGILTPTMSGMSCYIIGKRLNRFSFGVRVWTRDLWRDLWMEKIIYINLAASVHHLVVFSFNISFPLLKSFHKYLFKLGF